MNRFGLKEDDYHFIKDTILKYLGSKQNVKIFVFGSRPRGDFKAYSDIDLWIEAKSSVTAAELEDLNEIFEESDLAIKVDLVTPGTVFEDYLPSNQRELVEF